MRGLAFVLAAALAAAACGKYGPPVRTTEPAPAKPAPAQPDTEKSQDPNAPAQRGATP